MRLYLASPLSKLACEPPPYCFLMTRYQTSDSKYDRQILVGEPCSIEGPVGLLIRRAVAKVEEIVKASHITLGDQTEPARYPIAAVHEIIANAVLHRDYSLKDDVHVGIYDNRIEVTSPGRLPGHITPQNILDERFMRNPKIVRLVNKLPDPPNKDIGEGLNTAFKEMSKANLKIPLIEELDAAVKVTLRHDRIASRAQLIVQFLRDNGRIKNRQAREITGKESANAMYKVFSYLVNAGIIRVANPDASTSETEYELTDDWQANWLATRSRRRRRN